MAQIGLIDSSGNAIQDASNDFVVVNGLARVGWFDEWDRTPNHYSWDIALIMMAQKRGDFSPEKWEEELLREEEEKKRRNEWYEHHLRALLQRKRKKK